MFVEYNKIYEIDTYGTDIYTNAHTIYLSQKGDVRIERKCHCWIHCGLQANYAVQKGKMIDRTRIQNKWLAEN